jgi:FkbM family methyltransferase
VRTVHQDGLVWALRDETRDDLVLRAHEPGLLGHLDSPRKGCFVDVGAHVGKYTLRLAREYEIVHAVEPIPSNLAGLEINLGQNPHLRARVEIHPFAAWSTDNHRIIISDDGPYSSHHRGNASLIVQTRRLDSLVSERVDLVKIDVEGAEAAVLEGMTRILARDRPKLVIEMHEHMFERDSDVPGRCRDALYDYDIEQYRWVEGEAVYWICTA